MWLISACSSNCLHAAGALKVANDAFREAVARVQQPNLIIMVNLPGMDGYEVSGILRSDPLTADIPIIALSANAMAED